MSFLKSPVPLTDSGLLSALVSFGVFFPHPTEMQITVTLPWGSEHAGPLGFFEVHHRALRFPSLWERCPKRSLRAGVAARLQSAPVGRSALTTVSWADDHRASVWGRGTKQSAGSWGLHTHLPLGFHSPQPFQISQACKVNSTNIYSVSDSCARHRR